MEQNRFEKSYQAYVTAMVKKGKTTDMKNFKDWMESYFPKVCPTCMKRTVQTCANTYSKCEKIEIKSKPFILQSL